MEVDPMEMKQLQTDVSDHNNSLSPYRQDWMVVQNNNQNLKRAKPRITIDCTLWVM